MSQIMVRQATLADAASITALHIANHDTWTRRDIDGAEIPTAYDDLTLFERWQNGGPWASVEMCSVHLANLLRGGDGIPLVAEIEGQVGAEAEVFIGREPEPFGHHINVSRLAVHPDYAESGATSALLKYVQQMASAIRCKQITVAQVGEDAPLYEHHGFHRTHMGQRMVIPVQGGRVFYKAGDLANFDARQIDGWHMPLGRFQNAREEWDRMLPGFWNSVPEIVELEARRLHITVTGQEAYAFMQQDRHDPTRVHVYLWAKRAINPLLVMAMLDWAARSNYETLVVFVWDYVLPMLEVDTQPDGYSQVLYARSL